METKSRGSGAPAALGRMLLGLAVMGSLAACDDAVGPSASGTQTLSVSVALSSGAGPGPAPFAQGLQLSDGVNTLEIQSAELVLREIEFERVETTGCDDDISGDDDECEEFEVGPFLVSLPLDGGVATELTAQVDTGTYDEIEFEIHKPEDQTATDLQFIQDHPAFADASIRVTGTYNGLAFSYITDLNEDQEIELVDPLVVDEDTGPVNVTLTIDLSSWFRDAGGALIDPITALEGQPNEQLVEDNIEASIEGFRDDDGDGIRHGDDDDEDNS